MNRQLLFVGAILLSSFLIFLVQPMVGKRILPWYGGTPSVWTLCLAFYQTTLFLGYTYAHLVVRFASPIVQLGVHAAILSAAFLVLPILPPGPGQAADAANPSFAILAMLGSNVALPFMALASTGPLVQAWFARSYPDRSPYPLYAVSNIGSFTALLAYPLLFEPRISLSTTGALWSYAFAATAISVVACAFVALNSRLDTELLQQPESEGNPDRPKALQVALWILLSGCAVVLLMGITNSVCLDIASVPFLWILPLGTYLLTFVFCFATESFYRPIPLVIFTLIAFSLTVGLPFTQYAVALLLEGELASSIVAVTRSVEMQVPMYCALLFGSCMIMHGELYRLRPAPRDLTGFYLCVSGGGALGGIFVGLLAPVLFDDYYETLAGLALAMLLFVATAALRAQATNPRLRGWRWRLATPLAIGLGIVVLLPPSIDRGAVLRIERSFFGVLRVLEAGVAGSDVQHHLISGSTLHGVQFMDEGTRPRPTTYYGVATGIGAAFALRDHKQELNTGVIGLGVGTLSAYGRRGDRIRFYEIDPAVAEIAEKTEYFSYLETSLAQIDVVVGDARLELKTEQERHGSQSFDILVLDAFSSDAIPVHLLTLEAFRIYKDALAEGGILAVHVSNRHFNLRPLVARLGKEVGLAHRVFNTAEASHLRSARASWIMLSDQPGRLTALARTMRRRTKQLDLRPAHLNLGTVQRNLLDDVPLWTDDYSDLLGARR